MKQDFTKAELERFVGVAFEAALDMTDGQIEDMLDDLPQNVKEGVEDLLLGNTDTFEYPARD
jgi:hypothetical protein